MKNCRIGLGIGMSGESSVEAFSTSFRKAEEAGFQSAWVPNIFGFDALSLIALAGRETSSIELGSAVVPTHSRHPLYMAQQALTTQCAVDGRLALGLGPSHKIVIEDMLGLSYEKPAQHVREYVTIVKELIENGKTSFQGEMYRVNGALAVPGAKPCPILIGGLGPLMRRIAGGLVDGTVTWMTGPRTLGEELVPDIRAAAKEAGKPAPRIVCSLPIALTNDIEAGRERANQIFAIYGSLPSYRAMMDREGAANPGDLAILGDEATLEKAIEGLASAGVTDFNATVLPCGDDAAASVGHSVEFLAELARR